MPDNEQQTADREARLELVLAEYVRSEEQGQPLAREEVLAQHPDLADELRSFFRNRDAMQRLAVPLQDQAPTIGLGEREANGAANRIRYFGDYELLEELGRGGMGVVYKARQVSLNRPVAVKMILAGQLASADDIQRFRTEAEAAANLDHPQIAPIYETGEHQGQHYFSMKLIEGQSFREALPAMRSDISHGVELLAQVARAVHHAHQRGVLHRDLKPANVLLDLEARPYVTDFGLAKRVEGGSDMTRTGAIVGTPSYMAPEQATGEKQLSTAVDVYSLGAILYELLTGQPPFRADSPLETLLQVAAREVTPPRSFNAKVDRDLETVALKCLEKDPARRYDSAAALADDLDRWLRNEPIQARRATSSERLIKWSRRHPAAAALLIVTALALAGVGGLIWRGNAIELMLARAGVEQARRDKEQANDKRKAVEIERDETRRALTHGESLRLITQSSVELRHNPQRALLLALEGADRAQPRLAAHNNALLDVLQTIPRHTVWQLPKDHAGHVSVSCDGRFVVVLPKEIWSHFGWNEKGLARGTPIPMDDRPARVWDLAKGTGPILLRRPAAPLDEGGPHVGWQLQFQSADFSPDGQQILTLFNGQSLCLYRDGKSRLYTDHVARLWETATGKELAVLKGHTARILWARYFGDGKRIVTSSADRTTRIWEAATGKELMRLEHPATAISEPYGFSLEDGKYVVLGHGDGEVGEREFFRGEGKNKIKITPGEVDPPFALEGLEPPQTYQPIYSTHPYQSVSGRGRIGSVVIHPEMRTWDADGKLLSVIADDLPESLAKPFFEVTPRFTADVREARLVVTETITDREIAKFGGFEGELRSRVAVNDDGDVVVTTTSDETVRAWPLVAGDPYGLRLSSRQIDKTCWSPDGKRILTTQNSFFRDHERGVDGRVYDAATGKPLGTLRSEHRENLQCYNRAAAFSRDSKRVLLGFETSSDAKAGTHVVSVYEADTGKKVFGLPGFETETLRHADYSPDGRYLLTVSIDEADKDPVRLWDAASGQFLRTLTHEGGIRRPETRTSWSPDSRRVFVFTMGEGRFYDPATGKVVAEAPVDLAGHWDPCFSPDGEKMLTHQVGQAILWNARTGAQIAVLKGSFYSHGSTPRGRIAISGIGPNAVFSPDDKRIAAASKQAALLWDGDSGEQIAVLTGHSDDVRGIAFSPDGRWVATSATDGVRIWYADSGKEFFNPSKDQTWGISFSPDSRWLLTDKGWLWPVDPLASARARKSRDLTADERGRFQIGPAVTPARSVDVQAQAPVLHRERARLMAQGGQFQAAVESYRRALEWDPDDVRSVHELAVALLAAGDRDEYQRHCVAHVGRLKPKIVNSEWAWLARACALAPGLPDDVIAAAVAAAEADVSGEDDEANLAWGATLYRAGRYEEAINWLNKAVSNYPQGSLLKAMAYQRLGQAETAKQVLESAVARITYLRQRNWFEHWEAQLLRSEAEELIIGKTETP